MACNCDKHAGICDEIVRRAELEQKVIEAAEIIVKSWGPLRPGGLASADKCLLLRTAVDALIASRVKMWMVVGRGVQSSDGQFFSVDANNSSDDMRNAVAAGLTLLEKHKAEKAS